LSAPVLGLPLGLDIRHSIVEMPQCAAGIDGVTVPTRAQKTKAGICRPEIK
jgi:hypothetical protein